MRLDEEDHGAYVMNSRDLCLMPRLNELLDVGLDSFKIEGRNKSEYYVSVTARAYRKAIDDWVKDPKNWKPDAYMAELSTLQNRGYTLGFFDGNAGPESLNYEISASGGDWRYAGRVIDKTNDSIILEIKHKIEKGDEIEFLSPYQFEPIKITVEMSAEVGFFQIEEVLITKIDSSPAKQYVELFAGVDGEESKCYL